MKRKRWGFVAAAVAVVMLVVPAVGQGKADGVSLGWSRSRGGHTITSYGFGAVDRGLRVTRWFELGSSSSTKSGPLAITLTGSSAFWIAIDGCARKSIGENLSCWVGVTYVPVGGEAHQDATLTATPGHGEAASLSLSGSSTGPSGPGTLSWGSAIAVPGAAALNVAGDAGVNSVSCPSAGECAAGGDYATGLDAYYRFTRQAFVVSEQGGVWGTAIVPPGLAALNVGGYATVSSVSCASAGNCAAGGTYWDAQPDNRAFVVSEKDGVWGTAIEVQGLRGYAGVNSVSCVSPGNCTAGGFVRGHAFVVSEKDGTWGTAFLLWGTGGNWDYGAGVTSVSCAGVGDCVAGGYSTSQSTTRQNAHAFVAVERNGRWGHRRILTSGSIAQVTSVSCSNPGNCAAGGVAGSTGGLGGFVVDEKNGNWGETNWVAADTFSISVSCPSPGNCVAGGTEGHYDKYGDGSSDAYLVSEKNGKWGDWFVPPGVDPGDPDFGFAAVSSVSCASSGNCAATGVDANGGYVVAERGGVWGTAEEVPGSATIGPYSVNPFSVSCTWAGNCAVAGSYDDGAGHTQAFVTAP